MSQHHRFLERTECTRVLYGAEMDMIVQRLDSCAKDLVCTAFVSLREILAMEPRTFPYEKIFSKQKTSPPSCYAVLAQRASNQILSLWRKADCRSSGDPRLVTMTNGTFPATDLDRTTPTPPGRRAQNAALFAFPDGGKVYSCFPPYHLAGVQAFTTLPIFYGSTAVFGPSSMPASGHLLSEIMRYVEPKAVYVPPAITESWMQLPELRPWNRLRNSISCSMAEARCPQV